MAVSITISITQNSQSVANNTSNVTVQVNAKWTGGSYNLLQKSGYLIVDGTKYTFTSPFNTGRTTSGTCKLYSITRDIQHNSDGSKILACSASYTSGVSSGVVNASVPDYKLTTIPRKSTLSVSNGTLGTKLTMTVTRQSSSFTHTIIYKCGSTSGTVCSKSSDTTPDWTPPLSLANQNTTGTSVSIKFTITTYNGSASVGSNEKTISCSIPASVKPSCDVQVTDATGIYNTYGAYIKGLSKLKVNVKTTPAYSSAISKYNTTANGATYTGSSFTTDFIKSSGTVSISATVTDKRGRSGTDSASVSVVNYSHPIISELSVRRCNEDGTANDQGDHVQATFSATVTSLSGCTKNNTADYSLKYKKSSEAEYTEVALFKDNVDIPLSVTAQSVIFAAETASSYDVVFSVSDSFNTASRTTSVSTGFTIMHFGAEGRSIGLGKLAEIPDVLDIGFQTRLNGGLLYPVLEPKTDLNDVKTPNTYTGANVANYEYENCPCSTGTFTLIVECCGEDGQVKQTYISCNKYKPEKYSRFFYQSSWGEWFCASTDQVVLYDNESGSGGTISFSTIQNTNTGEKTPVSSGHFRYLEIYFTDNNGKSGGYTKVYKPDGKKVCLQIIEPSSTIYSRQTLYTISGTTMTPDVTNASYYRITSAGAVSTSFGTNYIKIIRVVGLA